MVRRAALVLSLLVFATATASAQDQALDPLLFAPKLAPSEQVTDVEAQTLQLYRLPLALTFREMKDGKIGWRLTFPVSLTSLKINRVSDIGPFARKLGIASIVPGIELEIPLDERVRLRPFGEVGFGKDTDEGRNEVLFGGGAGLMVSASVRRLRFTWGGQAMYRRSNTSGDEYGGHWTFEAGVDTETPLGLSIARKEARAGGYVIARRFAGLSLEREGQEPLTLQRQYEAGVSFSTTPELHIWKVKLPWLAAGYQFGHTLSGVRFYMKFPF